MDDLISFVGGFFTGVLVTLTVFTAIGRIMNKRENEQEPIKMVFTEKNAYWFENQDMYVCSLDQDGAPDFTKSEKIDMMAVSANDLPLLMEISFHLMKEDEEE